VLRSRTSLKQGSRSLGDGQIGRNMLCCIMRDVISDVLAKLHKDSEERERGIRGTFSSVLVSAFVVALQPFTDPQNLPRSKTVGT
jgi:hypothetical protein